MCNLYSITKSQDAVRRWFGTARDMAGNLPPLPDVYPDSMAPIIRIDGDARELRMMRWGFPPPPNLGTRPVTNIRNTNSPYWRGWLTPRYRCLVPATSFCEWTDSQPKVPHWFALGEDRPLDAFDKGDHVYLVIRQRPDFAAGYRPLAAAAAMAGDMDLARAALDTLRSIQPNLSLAWMASQSAHLVGRPE